MENLLNETISYLEKIGKTVTAISFIGSADGKYGSTWAEFAKLADFTYDDGYGGAEIPGDLVVVFNDNTWMARGEYDGSEWWYYNRIPKLAKDFQPITNLKRLNYESSVAEFQNIEVED